MKRILVVLSLAFATSAQAVPVPVPILSSSLAFDYTVRIVDSVGGEGWDVADLGLVSDPAPQGVANLEFMGVQGVITPVEVWAGSLSLTASSALDLDGGLGRYSGLASAMRLDSLSVVFAGTDVAHVRTDGIQLDYRTPTQVDASGLFWLGPDAPRPFAISWSGNSYVFALDVDGDAPHLEFRDEGLWLPFGSIDRGDGLVYTPRVRIGWAVTTPEPQTGLLLALGLLLFALQRKSSTRGRGRGYATPAAASPPPFGAQR